MKRLALLFVFLAAIALIMVDAQAVLAQQAQGKAPAAGGQVKPKTVKVDRNGDGVPDRTEVYADNGDIQRVESDTNDDGKIDEWIYYEERVPVKAQKDTNADGKPDTTIYYVKGVVIRTESDTNGDAKIDEWVYYSNGKPSKAEKDTNADGKPDTWIDY